MTLIVLRILVTKKQTEPMPPPPDHRSQTDFVNEIIAGSLRTKKTIQKKGKRSKKGTKRATTGLDFEEDFDQEEQQEEEEKWVKSSYQEVIKAAKRFHDEQGIEYTNLIPGYQHDQPLADDPEFDHVHYDGDCVGCSWVFAEKNNEEYGPFHEAKQFGIPRINELIFRLTSRRVPINIVCNIVHRYYVSRIYKPLMDSGHEHIPLWRTASIKQHILGHINNPRMVLQYFSQRVLENINGIQEEKWLKSVSQPGMYKSDREALDKEEKQMKLWCYLMSKDPSTMSTDGSQEPLKKILEDYGMGINNVY